MTPPWWRICCTGKKALPYFAATGDRGNASAGRALDAPAEEGAMVWGTPFKRKKGEDLTDEQRRINRFPASLRSNVEHIFRIIKRQFGYGKTRYRGLYKNGQQIMTLPINQAAANSLFSKHAPHPGDYLLFNKPPRQPVLAGTRNARREFQPQGA
jgi:hypothetical protein